MTTSRNRNAITIAVVTALFSGVASAQQAPDARRAAQEQSDKARTEEARTDEARTEDGHHTLRAEATSAPQPPRQKTETAIESLRDEGVRIADLGASAIRTLQEALRDDGYYRGRIDGIAGPVTRRALRQYYRDRAKLASVGKVTPESAEKLGQATEIERVRGEETALEREALRGQDVPDPQDLRMDNQRMRQEARDARELPGGVSEHDQYEQDVDQPERAYE